MSLRNIGIVYRKELIDSLRDRRTLISMIAVPLLLMPLLTIGMGVLSARLVGQAMEEVPKVMILGGEDSPKVRAELERMENVRIVPAKSDYAEEISSEQIRAAVEIPEGFDAKLASGAPMTVKIYMYEGELKSGFGADRLQQFFRDLRDRAIRERLEARQLPESLVRPFDIKQQNVAPAEKVGGAMLGGLVPYFVILLCLTGAMYPAMDLTAGEKERGTIETILCSPVSRTHLVLGKFLMVLTASLATAVLSITSMTVSFGVGKRMLLGMANGAAGRRRSRSHYRKGRDLRILHGASAGGVFFGGSAGHRAVCQEFQGGAELHFAPDDCCGPAGSGRAAAWGGTEHNTCARARAKHEPGQQRNHHRNLSLEIHRADLRIVLHLCRCGNSNCSEIIPAGRRVV